MYVILILAIVSLAVSAIGWKYFIYFFSIGYGFSISALAVAIALIFSHSLTAPTIILCCLLFVFGCRLGTYLLFRERRAPEYKKILYGPDASAKKPLSVVVTVWIFCAVLYVGQVSPVAFYLENSASGAAVKPVWAWSGSCLMLCGIILETVADMQKAAAKRRNPHRFVDSGVYRLVRCPNYLGELIIWTGCFVVCFGACCLWWQWIIAVVGYIGIVYVMFSGARRLELRQTASYGNDQMFQRYAYRTPLLLPFVPLYTLAGQKWLKA